jgi:hypothetical protein
MTARIVRQKFRTLMEGHGFTDQRHPLIGKSFLRASPITPSFHQDIKRIFPKTTSLQGWIGVVDMEYESAWWSSFGDDEAGQDMRRSVATSYYTFNMEEMRRVGSIPDEDTDAVAKFVDAVVALLDKFPHDVDSLRAAVLAQEIGGIPLLKFRFPLSEEKFDAFCRFALTRAL